MIERRRHKTLPATTNTSPEQAPILVVAIRIADQCIQNGVLNDGELRSSCSFRLHKNMIHCLPDICQSMTRLMKLSFGIVTVNGPCQHLVTVLKFPASSGERFGHGPSFTLERCQFYLCMSNPERRCHFLSNLLRPVLSRVCLGILEKPVRLVLRPAAIPELLLAAHVLRLKHPFRLNFKDWVWVRHGDNFAQSTSYGYGSPFMKDRPKSSAAVCRTRVSSV